MFFQNILKSKACDKSIQVRTKLFCHMIIKNYLCNVLCKCLIKFESMWRYEIKEQTRQMTLLYYGWTVRSSHRMFSIKKLFLKFRNISKNIYERLLFDCFNGLLFHGPKVSRSRLYDGVGVQRLSQRSIFLFLSHLLPWT